MASGRFIRRASGCVPAGSGRHSEVRMHRSGRQPLRPRVIGGAAFESARRLGGGRVAGVNRSQDLENMAYDGATDSLYVFSGSCCRQRQRAPHGLPAEARQRWPVPGGVLPAAPGRNELHRRGVEPQEPPPLRGIRKDAPHLLLPVQHARPKVPRAEAQGILGIRFGPGEDLWVVTKAERLRRVDWGTRRLVRGWTFAATVQDPRRARRRQDPTTPVRPRRLRRPPGRQQPQVRRVGLPRCLRRLGSSFFVWVADERQRRPERFRRDLPRISPLRRSSGRR
jgi:hypothetical protein